MFRARHSLLLNLSAWQKLPYCYFCVSCLRCSSKSTTVLNASKKRGRNQLLMFGVVGLPAFSYAGMISWNLRTYSRINTEAYNDYENRSKATKLNFAPHFEHVITFFFVFMDLCAPKPKKNPAQHLICSRFKGATAQWYIETDYRPHWRLRMRCQLQWRSTLQSQNHLEDKENGKADDKKRHKRWYAQCWNRWNSGNSDNVEIKYEGSVDKLKFDTKEVGNKSGIQNTEYLYIRAAV